MSSYRSNFSDGRPIYKRAKTVFFNPIRKNTTDAKATKALRLAKRVANSEEVKWTSHSDTDTATTAWATIGTDMLSLAQGDTINTRDGNSCYLKSIDWNYSVVRPADNDLAAIRVVLFAFKGSAFPTAPNPFTGDGILTQLDNTFLGNVSVLHDKTHVCNATGGQGLFYTNVSIPYRRKLYYDGAALANPQNLQLVVYIIGDTTGDTHCTITSDLKVNFTDS